MASETSSCSGLRRALIVAAYLGLIAASLTVRADDYGRHDVNEVSLSGTIVDLYVTAPGPAQRVGFHVAVNYPRRLMIEVICAGADAIGFGCTDYVGNPATAGSRIFVIGVLLPEPDGKITIRVTVPPQIFMGCTRC